MIAIPEEIRTLKRWHNWRDVNGTKIPLQVNGEPAKSNDPDTWTDFETADAFGSLAFELGDGYCGVDLDNCLDVFGHLREWAYPIVSQFDGVAYMEISPSGNGIKFITRGKKPDGARCVHKIGEDKQQIECYDKTRFWTVTGQVYSRQTEIGDGQAAIDWLCERYLAPMNEKPPETVSRPVNLTGCDLQRRASDYTDSVPPAGAGGRNNAAFNLAGHLFAMSGDFNSRLSEEQVLNQVRSWNVRNFEPLPDDELQKAVNSAGKNGTPRAEKPPQEMPAIVADPDVDLSGIMRQCNVPEEIIEATVFPTECLDAPGLIGDLVKYNLETALYPLPELALAGALALLSSVTGGKAKGLRARTNMYIMGLAPSGGGKDYARKLNRKILMHAGGGSICGPERIGSHAGIISALAENWNTLFQIDEIGRLLATMQNAGHSPHLYNIASVLMQIYSSADDIWQADAYGDRNKCKTLEFPHCVVYGTSVPDGFWQSLTKENLSDGLIGRFLVFENAEYVDFQDVDEEELPQSVVDRCKDWLDHKTHGGNLAGMTNHDAAHPQEVETDEQSAARLKKHAADISMRRKHEDPVEAAIWSRHAEKTNKLALLFACSRWQAESAWPTINLADANRAIKLNNYLTRRMLKQAGVYVSESSFETAQLKVLRVIKRRQEWTQNQLTRSTRWLKPRERIEILQTLQESGEIDVEEHETGGRPARVFRARK